MSFVLDRPGLPLEDPHTGWVNFVEGCYIANCSCGWHAAGSKEAVDAAVQRHTTEENAKEKAGEGK